LRSLSNGHGLSFPEKPKLLTVQSDNHKEYVDKLAEDHEATLILSFTQSEDDELYDLLKQELLVKYGVLSQNISFDKAISRIEEYRNTRRDGDAKTILTLIAMQICAKLGGAPWAFNEPIYEEGCPILGLDVYHSEDDTEGSDSVVGACAVFDPYGEYLFSDVSSLEITQPVQALTELIKGAIKHLEDEGKKPKKLLILRSGLNFTQEQKFLYDKEHGELAIIEKALKECGVPEYVFVLHKKGTSLRMYKKIKEFQVDNPEPGTTVIGTPFDDNEILMISQQTYVGTAEPVMFKVLSHNADMKKLATAIYKLCRHHWSSARTIRVPAPALHADMITHFVRLVLRQRPTSRQVLDRPFYL
jgi:argonaute-like protein implicated in RNA metabolism and viral defense